MAPCDSRTALLALLMLSTTHAMLSPARVVAWQGCPRWRRCGLRPQRCSSVRSQIFPGDFTQKSEREADEAGDAARAVLRAMRAIGSLPPDTGPSQEWAEGALDDSGAPFWWREQARARIGPG